MCGLCELLFLSKSSGNTFPLHLQCAYILRIFQDKGWANKPNSGYLPKPGDVVVWWRDQPSSGKGHIGLVHQLRDGFLYTIEGNKSPKVQGFSYVMSRMDKLLGFGHVPDA